MSNEPKPQNNDFEIEQSNSGFLSQFGGIKNSMLTIVGFIGSIASVIAWIETEKDSTKYAIGAFFCLFVMFISFLILSYIEYRKNQNQKSISIIPQNNNIELPIYSPIAQINVAEKPKEQDKALELPSIEDKQLEPNIVFLGSNNSWVDFNQDQRCWIEYGYFNRGLIFKFGNEPKTDGEKIGELSGVNAQIEFYDKAEKLIYSLDQGMWLDTRGSVWLKFGDRQRLLVVYRDNYSNLIIPTRSESLEMLSENFYKIKVRLVGNNQWYKDFNFELRIDKNSIMSIKEV